MNRSRARDIKHAQRESALLQKIGQFFIQIIQDAPELQKLSVTRVQLSPEKGLCTVFFHGLGGLSEYEALRSRLVLYKASIRKALSQAIHTRYTPELRFAYDTQLDKQQHMDDLIEKLKREGKL
jgi:ribosome-binding factor A